MISLQNQLGSRMMCLILFMYIMVPNSFKDKAIAFNLTLLLQISVNFSHVMIRSFVIFKCVDNQSFT